MAVNTHRIIDASSGRCTHFGLEETIEDIILLSLSTWPTILLSLMNALLMTWRQRGEQMSRLIIRTMRIDIDTDIITSAMLLNP